MDPQDARRAGAALGLMAHSIIATKAQTAEETVACNRRFTAARDWLQHAPARPVMGPGVRLSAAEMEVERENALAYLRSLCGACGLCARFDVKPP
jgi:hypothetical protein